MDCQIITEGNLSDMVEIRFSRGAKDHGLPLPRTDQANSSAEPPTLASGQGAPCGYSIGLISPSNTCFLIRFGRSFGSSDLELHVATRLNLSANFGSPAGGVANAGLMAPEQVARRRKLPLYAFAQPCGYKPDLKLRTPSYVIEYVYDCALFRDRTEHPST